MERLSGVGKFQYEIILPDDDSKPEVIFAEAMFADNSPTNSFGVYQEVKVHNQILCSDDT